MGESVSTETALRDILERLGGQIDDVLALIAGTVPVHKTAEGSGSERLRFGAEPSSPTPERA